MKTTTKKKKNMNAAEFFGTAIGFVIAGIIGLFLLCVPVAIVATIVAAFVYVLMNVLLPVVGFVYPLTMLQCYAVAGVVFIVRILIRLLIK